MSAVSKAAGIGRYILAAIVILFVVAGIGVYMNVESIGKDFIERSASHTLGVPVTIGDMELSVEEKRVVLKDIKIANPAGYDGEYATTADEVLVAVDRFERKRIMFNTIEVKGMKVNLEVKPGTTNLNDIKLQAALNSKEANVPDDPKHNEDLSVIIRVLYFQDPVLIPTVTLVETPYAGVTAKDIEVRNIGVKEGGISVHKAIYAATEEAIKQVNLAAVQAEFFKGMSLDSKNAIGVSTMDVFKKNVNKKIEKDMGEAKKLFDSFFSSEQEEVSDDVEIIDEFDPSEAE